MHLVEKQVLQPNNRTIKQYSNRTVENMINELIINDNRIVPGQNSIVKLNIARLPSGTKIHLSVHVYRSATPGPTVLVSGGLHGDEVNGVEIVRRMIASRLFTNITCGNVIAIPLLNIYGFNNFSRDVTEGKDANRSFPGSKNGSLASRVAYTLSSKILPLIDFGIDYHTGGSSRYNYPQIRFSRGDDHAEALAKTFAAPYLIRSNVLNKTLRKTAMDMNIPILVFEGGESLRFDALSIKEGIAGLKRVLCSKGMLPESAYPTPSHSPRLFNKMTWLRADRSGLFRWIKSSGILVEAGELLGVINDPDGQTEVPVLASKKGCIIGHNNSPVINRGEPLFHLGLKEDVM